MVDGQMATKIRIKRASAANFSATCPSKHSPIPFNAPCCVHPLFLGAEQAYSMILASSPSKKVNISFSDPALGQPLSNGPGGNFIRRGNVGAVQGGRSPGRIRGMSISTRGSPLTTPASAPASNRQHLVVNHRSDSPLTSPTQQRVRSLSSASSLSRGRTAPLRAVCHYKRAASLGAVSK